MIVKCEPGDLIWAAEQIERFLLTIVKPPIEVTFYRNIPTNIVLRVGNEDGSFTLILHKHDRLLLDIEVEIKEDAVHKHKLTYLENAIELSQMHPRGSTGLDFAIDLFLILLGYRFEKLQLRLE
jgi:uncharacterized membrane protein YqaE (UPF0057 family)